MLLIDMKLSYEKLLINIEFEQDVVFKSQSRHIFRSVFGNQLRKLTCVQPDISCDNCIVMDRCPYAFLFETPISGNNTILKGCNRLPPPMLMWWDDKSTRSIDLTLTLIGRASEFLPYIYLALKKAGEEGIFKERIRFTVKKISSEGRPLLMGDSLDLSQRVTHEWSFDDSDYQTDDYYLVSFISPVFLKKELASYSLKGSEFFWQVHKRLQILSAAYGEISGEPQRPQFRKLKSDAWLFKTDFHYFSSRQKESIQLGGMMGALRLREPVNHRELSLLQGAELFGIGKKTSFGLGRVLVEKVVK